MNIDIKIQLLSLNFIWVLCAAFCTAIYISYRRTHYPYLRFAIAALLVDLLRQVVNDLTLVWTNSALYAASSLAFFAEALLCLYAIVGARERSLSRTQLAAAVTLYLASIAIANVHPDALWFWYVAYLPVLVLHALAVQQAWVLYRERWQAALWLMASNVAVLATRLVLPWLSTDANLVYAFVYFVDVILFSLAMGSIMLVALEQLAAERSENVEERRLAESTVRFLLDNTEDVIISHANDGTVLSWNNRARDMFGYADSEIVGRLHIDRLIMPASGNDETRRRETVAFSRDGRRIPVEVARRAGVQGDMIHNTLVIRDLSTVREIEARQELLSDQLRELQKLESLGVLAAGIAHDFNNLLATMVGHAELAAKQLMNPMRARMSISQVLTAANRASELIEQMLTYAGKVEFNPTPIDLNATIEEIVALMTASIDPRAGFTLELTPGGARISADRAQLTQVLINLISNASDALTSNEGCIRITTSTRFIPAWEIQRLPLGDALPGAEYVVMQVQDNGEGMQEDVRKRVFEPFFSTKFTGRGLGLAAVAGIVKKHRGAVSVESAPGTGTTFTFYFPASLEVTPPADDVRPDYVPVRRGLSILVVDDNPDMLDLCESILAAAGHAVRRAQDGRHAIETARQWDDLDLLVMDYGMPDINGLRVYETLLADGLVLPAVFITGQSPAEVRKHFGPGWPAAVLKKPFMADDLLESVDLVSDGEKRAKERARR